MSRHQVSFHQLLAVTAIAILMAGATVFPARADDVSTNESQIIHRLLPTVVNIAVQKVEAIKPPAATTAVADAPDAGSAKLVPEGPTTVKGYVGSGFIIDPSGLIVTNYHVVDGAFQITVTLSDGTRLVGKTVSASRLADLALVQVQADHPLPAAHWGNSDMLQVGDQVFAAGNPFGLGLSVAAGIVSALNRDIQNSPYDDLIQTDATLNHGNSGGPLFDMQGNVIGVDSTIISPTTGSVGLGFAIPSNSARFVVDQLRTYGWVHPGWIGVKVQTMTDDLADAMGLAQPKGSVVSWVLSGGPAMKSGLKVGDVILQFGDRKPSDERALLRAIAQTSAGVTTSLLVLRDGKRLTLPITVDAWPRNQWEALDAPAPIQRPNNPVPPHLGLSLEAVPAAEKAELGLVADLNGVLVTNVVPESDPARRGVVKGDVILRVQDKPVATPADVWAGVDAVRASKRDFVMMLILPKVRDVPGPKWVPLRLVRQDQLMADHPNRATPVPSAQK
jgi:serine protease Do